MRSIIEVVEELMNMNSNIVEIENPIKYDEACEKIDEKIKSMWNEFSVEEVSKELKKYEIKRWDFVDYIWKVKEYM